MNLLQSDLHCAPSEAEAGQSELGISRRGEAGAALLGRNCHTQNLASYTPLTTTLITITLHYHAPL